MLNLAFLDKDIAYKIFENLTLKDYKKLFSFKDINISRFIYSNVELKNIDNYNVEKGQVKDYYYLFEKQFINFTLTKQFCVCLNKTKNKIIKKYILYYGTEIYFIKSYF